MIAAAAPAAGVSISSLLQLTLSLGFVVALIFAITWVLKRFNLHAPRASKTMAIQDELALGPRERILLVRVGASQILIGVGAGGVVSFAPLTTAIAVPDAANPGNFASRLRELMHGAGTRQ